MYRIRSPSREKRWSGTSTDNSRRLAVCHEAANHWEKYMEVWKDIYGYEGLYEVSSLGRVRSKHKDHLNQIMKQRINHGGYCVVSLSKNGVTKQMFVHVLVLQAFDFRERLPGYNKNLVVDHIDFDRQNNRVENLHWCTQSENLERSSCNRHWGKKCIDRTTGKIYKTMTDAARDISAPTTTCIKRVCDGERKNYKGHCFQYLGD